MFGIGVHLFTFKGVMLSVVSEYSKIADFHKIFTKIIRF